MKFNLTFLLSLFSLIFILSCSSDDDTPAPPPPASEDTPTPPTDDTPEPPSPPTQAELILGSWDMTSTKVEDGSATRTVQGFPATFSFTGEGKDYDYQLTFNEDNEVSEQGSFTMVLAYSVLGQNMTQEIPLDVSNNGLLLSGTYGVEEDQLLVTEAEQDITATIDELTETSLNLSIDLEALAPALLGNEFQNVSGLVKIVFTKVE